MQSAEMLCISSWSTTGGSTGVCHEDGMGVWVLWLCELAELEKGKRIYVWRYMDVFLKAKESYLKMKVSIKENGKLY